MTTFCIQPGLSARVFQLVLRAAQRLQVDKSVVASTSRAYASLYVIHIVACWYDLKTTIYEAMCLHCVSLKVIVHELVHDVSLCCACTPYDPPVSVVNIPIRVRRVHGVRMRRSSAFCHV